jgi:glycosyltransferase involved in cell wall biosynthesis
LRRIGPGLIVLHYTTGSRAVATVRQYGAPFALYFHNITPAHYFLGANDLLAGYAWRGVTELSGTVQGACLAIAPSSFSLDHLRRIGATRLAQVPIPLPDDLDYAKAHGPTPGWANGGPVVLFVGRLAPNKRQDVLIDAVAWINRRRSDDVPRVRLVLIGSDRSAPAYGRRLREYATRTEPGTVIFAGHVSNDERTAAYRHADVFASASEHEGFGSPLIEAMHFGVPVVARAAAAIAETVGDGGLVIEGADAATLGATIELILARPELGSRLRDAGSRRAQAFRSAAIAPTFLDAIGRALATPTPGG